MSKLRVILKHIPLNNFSKVDKDALSVFCRKTGFCVLSDRFGYLNKFSNWNLFEIGSEFPNMNASYNFSDLMYERGEEIVRMAKKENRQIFVLYSGGVDSTALLLSLIHASIQDYSNIKVVHSISSIEEYPKFYSYLKKLKLELICMSLDDGLRFCSEKAKTDYVITGCPADQLFGSIVNQRDELVHNSDWRTFIKEDNAIGQFEEAFHYYGLPICKLNEFTWFMNFSVKWDFMSHLIPQIVGMEDGNTINFYDTKKFQDWSVSNFDKLHIYSQKDPIHYKVELKEFIQELFKDEEYLKKPKIGSLLYAHQRDSECNKADKFMKPFIALLEEDYKLITHFYPKEVLLKDCEKIEKGMITKILLPYRKIK